MTHPQEYFQRSESDRMDISTAIREIDIIVRELPYVTNPRREDVLEGDYPTCMYEKNAPRTFADMPEHKRCIVGELVHRMGWQMPEYGTSISASMLIEDQHLGWPIDDRHYVLSSIQRQFDSIDPSPHNWHDAWEECKMKYDHIRSALGIDELTPA